MKVAIISDTHWGARGDSPAMLEHSARFYHDFFFPEIRRRGVERIVHLGDLVDRRKYVSFKTAMAMRLAFLDPAADFGMDVIAGNHDCYHKNSNEINALRELVMGRYPDRIRIYSGPTELTIGSRTRTVLLPWICASNERESMGLVHGTQADWCMGHLEMAGFKMYRDSPEAQHGLSPADFTKFTGVLSGHFHHKSVKGNVMYVGAPYEMNWSDAGDDRGFHVYDEDTGDMEFVRNPVTLHAKLHYDDGGVLPPESEIRGKVVKVIVKSRQDGLQFDSYMKRLEGSSPADVQVVDDHLHLDLSVTGDDEEMVGVEDTPSVLRQAVAGLEGSIDKSRLSSLLLDVYQEAVTRR